MDAGSLFEQPPSHSSQVQSFLESLPRHARVVEHTVQAHDIGHSRATSDPTQVNTDWIPRHMQMKDIRFLDDPSRIERCRLR